MGAPIWVGLITGWITFAVTGSAALFWVAFFVAGGISFNALRPPGR